MPASCGLPPTEERASYNRIPGPREVVSQLRHVEACLAHVYAARDGDVADPGLRLPRRTENDLKSLSCTNARSGFLPSLPGAPAWRAVTSGNLGSVYSWPDTMASIMSRSWHCTLDNGSEHGRIETSSLTYDSAHPSCRSANVQFTHVYSLACSGERRREMIALSRWKNE